MFDLPGNISGFTGIVVISDSRKCRVNYKHRHCRSCRPTWSPKLSKFTEFIINRRTVTKSAVKIFILDILEGIFPNGFGSKCDIWSCYCYSLLRSVTQNTQEPQWSFEIKTMILLSILLSLLYINEAQVNFNLKES